MTSDVDICLIEDDPAQRALVETWLTRHGYSFVTACDGLAGLRLVYQHHPRIVLSDVFLQDLNGIELCTRMRLDPSLDGIYVVLITAYDEPGQRKQALLAGADDYLLKPYDFDEVQARINNGMRLHQLQDRLRRAAVTDGLTELWNHAYFREALERELVRTRRYGGVLSLMMVDLDHFKAINDTFGHELGNEVLCRSARYLREAVREPDIVARYGGEEFAIILPETGLTEAAMLAERIRAGLARTVQLKAHPSLVVRCSIGVACTSDPRVNAIADLIDLSDRALYAAKLSGRNQVMRCDQLETRPDPPVHGDEVDRLRKEVVGLSMRMKDLCLQSVWALIQALEARDNYSAWHSQNVKVYTRWLAEAAGFAQQLRVAVTNAAMLHDLGKIGMRDELLQMTQSTHPEETDALQQVPLVTCRILEPLRVFETEINVIRHLRERWDGSGSPDRLSGERIPLGSRLLAVTEAFDSLTCDRAGRAGRSVEQALAAIAAASGAQFDPDFVALLAHCVREDPLRWQAQVERARVRMARPDEAAVPV